MYNKIRSTKLWISLVVLIHIASRISLKNANSSPSSFNPKERVNGDVCQDYDRMGFYMEQCRLFSRPGMRLHQISLKEIGREQGTNTNQR